MFQEIFVANLELHLKKFKKDNYCMILLQFIGVHNRILT